MNSEQGPEWKVWEHPDLKTRGVQALEAAKCAELQGEDAFERFHLRLFAARHDEGRDPGTREVLIELARESGLDVARFTAELDSRRHLAAVGKDHEEAASLGIFGVPTLLFDGREPTFLKMRPVPDSVDEAMRLFEGLWTLTSGHPYVLELKKPASMTLSARK